jgi:AbrB family looped-hinge helix DNA binding protein
MTHTTLRGRGQVTLPSDIRNALHLEEGDEVDFAIVGPDTVVEPGDVLVRGMRMIPVDQAWFWTESWQAGEREVDEQIKAGEGTFFGSDEEFLAALDEELR